MSRVTEAPATAQAIDLVEVAPGQLIEVTRGEVDVQITTAKRYPRSIRTFIDTATEMAVLDEETAGSCFYALPRDGKTVEGPSARLAEICASAWGNLRAQTRITDETDRFIVARGEAWDLQANVAIGFEVRRRITNRQGKKYTDDMVMVTGNAASSIALRNAVFKVIPSAFWRPIYLKCREVAVGKAETLVAKRTKMLAYFQKMGVEAARVFALLGVKGVEDVTLDHMATLHGLATAIKEGDTSVDEAFPLGGKPGQSDSGKPATPIPDGYEAALDDLRAVADEGLEPLTNAFAKWKPALREYLTSHDSAVWEGLKAKAESVTPTADPFEKGASS